jgi:hypothetical protein
VRFADAEKINPFQLLVDLHDHVIARPAKVGRDDTLAELALSASSCPGGHAGNRVLVDTLATVWGS